ncbi:CD225/dispanin family protein [Thermosynechococcaceae cyanobacterium BACA0444]|uniref:CD225/dispanin family protein n=1 Tax=Pseudocalidococcus azoricus BACA0444 TaxID=2918990 RepID=A0AAE4FP30_9CYAN|nr:CD225/dispanin family protein [Pseudocalidococcus azoricus]MDS3859624.1 CD225/dispanin family protein [Pseudocalidococcus azoricus BACA0444]
MPIAAVAISPNGNLVTSIQGMFMTAAQPVPNYLVPAILSTVCCCIPFGIVAIVYASQVNTKLAAGDRTGAIAASEKAKLWSWIAFGSGLAISVIYIIIQVIAFQAVNQ